MKKGRFMKTVQIGYRRLYDSMGCSIVGQKTLHTVFPFGEHLQVEIYMGNKPTFGVTIETEHEDYLIPGAPSRIGKFAHHGDATQSPYPRSFFTEIICSHTEGVSDELFDALSCGDISKSQELLVRAEAHEEEYSFAADLFSGVIGLRFHPQFTMKLLNENFVAFHGEKRVFNNSSSTIRLLEEIILNEAGLAFVEQVFPEFGKLESKTAKKAGRILGWLIRAWPEQDNVAKFNALFISLEMILEGVSGVLPQDLRSHIETLQKFIEISGGEEKSSLKETLGEILKRIRPSLIDRFNALAEQAKMPGWENDKKAFKNFNATRNGLTHRGDPNVKMLVSVGKEEVLALEDLTERYANYFLFKDTAVYQSIYVPRPKP
jgi:hypothetical protein